MRKILTVAVLATALIGGIAGPSFAEGDYIPGPTAIPSWMQADGRTPLASSTGSYFAQPEHHVGGDDHYVPGSVASQAWTGAGTRSPLASNSGRSVLEQSGATGGGGQHS
jgi:hypothetical protein